ncbi:MAG: helix-turn-helix domain-containing protein [Oscillospiraceae bacterium]|nr:helix-turn-helix domain-containing protein [Oscillospiraceae bacterium]
MARWKCDMNCFECKFPDCRNGKIDPATIRAEKEMLYRVNGREPPPVEDRRRPKAEKEIRANKRRRARMEKWGPACYRIRERRKESGLTITQCANRYGCSFAHFNEMELGATAHPPDLDKLEDLFPGIKEELQPLFDKIKEEEKS